MKNNELKFLLYKDATEDDIDGILTSLRCLLPHSPIINSPNGFDKLRLTDFYYKFNGYNSTYNVFVLGVLI